MERDHSSGSNEFFKRLFKELKEFIENLFKKRSRWIDANRDNGFDEGIATLLKELYPDNAHFLYELLQNAEDAEATKVSFVLDADRLKFIHNGRFFQKEDIDGITGIGNTKKKNELNSIGKFGVGFKAVFSYTKSPLVHCDSCSFGIMDMVCPVNVERPADLARGQTLFDFPFDSPKKSKKDAFFEIREGLNGFSSATLLFLHNIKTIHWETMGESLHFLKRKEDRRGLNGLPVFNIESDSAAESIYWLRLSAPCKEEPAHPVSIALQLTSKKNVKKGGFPFSVVPVDSDYKTGKGRLCIFFPADKEITKLFFHIHAPFVSTVDRASIPYKNRDNISLRDQLSQLLASSLPMLRDAGLLTSRLLEILPNSTDELGEFYVPFISTVVAEMQASPLVPAAAGGFALAEELARGPKRIRDFITDEDLQFLSEEEFQQWATGTFNPRAEQLLKDLGIPEWSSEKLVGVITSKWGGYYHDEDTEWLKQKDIVWIRNLYLCLSVDDVTCRLKRCAIVLATDASFKKPSDIVFKPAGNNLPAIDGISFVHPAILKGDKDEVQKIRVFLQSMGVMELDEVHFIKSLLSKHYSDDEDEPSPAVDEHLEHVKRFVKYWKQTGEVEIFEDYLVVYSEESDGVFCSPENVYLDGLLCPTELGCVFSESKYLVSHRYESIGEDFLGFAKALGVFWQLAPEKFGKLDNPQLDYSGRRYNVTGYDYRLPKVLLDQFCRDADVSERIAAIRSGHKAVWNGKFFDLSEASHIPISLKVWEMMSESPKEVLRAYYSPNNSHGSRGESCLVQILRSSAWIPDKAGNFHKPAQLTEEELPDEFICDDSNGWLTAVGFGAQVEAEKFEQEETTKRLRKEGIDLSLEDLKALSEIPKEDLHSLLDEYKARAVTTIDFPEVAPKNPERRKKKIEKRYQGDPEKKFETRLRTVRASGPTEDPREYLEGLYTNDDDQLVCQMCRKEMPFKLRSGRYYFETVQLIDDFKTESRELYVALCPVCAAKYKTLVKNHPDSMRSLQDALPTFEHNVDQTLNIHDPKLPDLSIRFTETHLEDIRTVVECESDHGIEIAIDVEAMTDALSNILLGERTPLDISNKETGEVLIPAQRKITKTCIQKIIENAGVIEIDPSPFRIKVMSVITDQT